MVLNINIAVSIYLTEIKPSFGLYLPDRWQRLIRRLIIFINFTHIVLRGA